MSNVDNTESPDLTKIKTKLQKYADSKGFKLNENPQALKGIFTGLLRNKEKHGEIYCPCRVVTGNKEEDKKIICPCAYHLQEIKEDRHCKCALFWKK